MPATLALAAVVPRHSTPGRRLVYPSRFPAVAPAQRSDSWAVAYQAGPDNQTGIEFHIAAK